MKPATLAIISALLLLPVAAAQTEQQVFTASAGGAPWGYDYAEDCVADGTAISCAAHAGDSAYLGKELEGKNAYRVEFTIRASGSDGEKSKVRVAFGASDLPANSQTKGDGSTSESFANSIKLTAVEEGSVWSASLWDVKNGGSTKLGSTFDMGSDANNFQNYALTVDLASQTVKLVRDGIVEAERNLVNDHQEIHSQWFVFLSTDNGCFGTGSGCPATTYLTTAQPSTTIYDMDNHAPVTGEACTNLPMAADASYAVTVEITDDWDTSVTASLEYSANGIGQAPIPMTATGTTYTASLPAQAADTNIIYYVLATDSGGETSRSDNCQLTVGSGDGSTNLGGGTNSGGGTSNLSGEGDRDYILLAGLSLIAGVGVFILLRRKQRKLATAILLVALAATLIFALLAQGIAIPLYAYFLVPVGYGAFVLLRRNA